MKKAVLVLMTVASLALSTAAGAGNLPEGNMGSGGVPTAENETPEIGFGAFSESSLDSADADLEATSTNLPEAQVGSGTTPN